MVDQKNAWVEFWAGPVGAGTSNPSCVLDVIRLSAGVRVRVGKVGAEET